MYETLILFIILGFIAQIIDGALGMAYGISLTTFLLGIGVPPATASASVHTAEIFTSGASGISHLKLGNVDKELFTKLLIPGIIGGIVGAYILTSIPGKIIKPFVALYLLIMGIIILRKAFKKTEETTTSRAKLFPLGLIGGFFDAIGGGGWGPIVTSTLVARGHNPRFTIGTVNLAEFFVTITEVATFITMIGLVQWQIILGLIIGGVTAAPLAAYICKRMPSKALMIMVGILIITLSIRTIYQTML
ncbi:sulfite exporter TauE/SafE family protein [Candidatus Bathyarchaeota archaeon]|nr:sulfite exporter TauE/SafE family protein [Candidatus Bathyarchaeota archaeon]